eukprot:CAMPEP_0172632104 /NCGR_PEP_ID=MMETSP1068-20121228/182753_1 /TAXON_ID=35684 /ORGANISM="Pseudopedinella elastica, Strain CCMP716" /LENGTH=185 /DNA_ID=CAMNT_0013443413 /DNA_START=294 /DNA_END=849 /DNA_ORIENTATION=+
MAQSTQASSQALKPASVATQFHFFKGRTRSACAKPRGPKNLILKRAAATKDAGEAAPAPAVLGGLPLGGRGRHRLPYPELVRARQQEQGHPTEEHAADQVHGLEEEPLSHPWGLGGQPLGKGRAAILFECGDQEEGDAPLEREEQPARQELGALEAEGKLDELKLVHVLWGRHQQEQEQGVQADA